MRREDKSFDPFAESTVDGIIAGTVEVKVFVFDAFQKQTNAIFVSV